MSSNSESLWTKEDTSAPRYREASWQAYELETEPPDPASLSDNALYAFLHYEDLDFLLPSAALEAVEAESIRRGASTVVDTLTALAMLVLLSVVGVVIGLGLLTA